MRTPNVPDRSSEAAELLKANAHDFLNGGISLLFDAATTPTEAKIAVVSIQAAIELYAKYRIVRELGLNDIIRKGAVPRGGSLLAAAERGQFSTVGYGECLKTISQLEWINDWQTHLIEELQRQRNTLTHFAGELDIDQARSSVAGLLVQVLALFAAGPARDENEMLTHRQFLEPEQFVSITSHPEYLAEAFDAASGDPDAEAIFTCWSCEHETLTLRPTDSYFCWTCGLSAHQDVAAFTKCWSCHREKSVCYDRLNNSGGTHYGRCLVCHAIAYVGACEWCGDTRSQAAPEFLKACTCNTDS